MLGIIVAGVIRSGSYKRELALSRQRFWFKAESIGRKTAAPMAIGTAGQKLAPRSGLSIIWLMTGSPIAFVPVVSGALGHSPLLAVSAVFRPQSAGAAL